MPLLVLLTIFVVAPLVELYVLIEVGTVIGAIPTIALSVFTAVLGGMLVRLQGLSVLFRVRESLEREEVPALEMLEGALLLIAGVLLLLPGFITDVLGFLLLISPLRRRVLIGWLKRQGALTPAGPVSTDRPTGRVRGHIEGDYRRED
jgi:UPF0716 protein FxsA